MRSPSHDGFLPGAESSMALTLELSSSIVFFRFSKISGLFFLRRVEGSGHD